MPFEAKLYGSRDFTDFSHEGGPMDDIAWGSCLQSRDLVVIRATNAGVEVYCPTLVARKFGFMQLLPMPPSWTLNNPLGERSSITLDEAAKVSTKAHGKILKFVFTPFPPHPVSTKSFND